MEPIKNSLIGAAIGLLGMASAQASAIYNWQPLTDTENFSTTGGRLVISNNAFESGRADFSESVNYDVDPDDPAYNRRFPDSSIVSVRMTFMAPGRDNSLDVSANPTRGRNVNSINYSLDAQANVFADLLNGNIRLFTFASDFGMSSDKYGLWTIDAFNSDDPIAGNCHTTGVCGGATGRWQLAETTQNVPAPTVWPLSALSVLALSGALFSRKRFGKA